MLFYTQANRLKARTSLFDAFYKQANRLKARTSLFRCVALALFY
jgi:hypothetical protein